MEPKYLETKQAFLEALYKRFNCTIINRKSKLSVNHIPQKFPYDCTQTSKCFNFWKWYPMVFPNTKNPFIKPKDALLQLLIKNHLNITLEISMKDAQWNRISKRCTSPEPSNFSSAINLSHIFQKTSYLFLEKKLLCKIELKSLYIFPHMQLNLSVNLF